MKKLSLFASLLAVLFFVACQNSNSGQAVETGEAQDAATASEGAVTYAIDKEASVIMWEGYKPAKYSHTGIIQLKDGSLAVNEGNIEGGSFVIDMTTLTNLDVEDPKDKAKLEGHLKSGDFFEVDKYPTGQFEITKVEPMTGGDGNATHKITGNLTLKGITKSIELPANVAIDGDKVVATTPEFTINRTEWDVKFNSGVIGTVGDALIADDVKLKIDLMASSSVR